MKAGRARLTLTEARVARLIAEGRTDQEIAERLGTSVIEVDADLAELYQKLGVRSRTELAMLMSPSTDEMSDRTASDGPMESEAQGQSEGSTTS